MYYKVKVKIPQEKGKIVIGRNKYVMLEIGRKYDKEKKYNVPVRVAIGKVEKDTDTIMIPNERYAEYFYNEEINKIKREDKRSSCIKVGTYILLQKIIKEKKLDEILGEVFGEYGGLILDLACYMIVEGSNANQYYEDYCYNHLTFSEKYKIYSDSTISKLLKEISDNQKIEFLNKWNEKREAKEQIYVSYDSTNRNCQAGEISFAEFGHAKDNEDKPIINMSVAYDKDNREPLFYETYPGSIVDISQLNHMVDKAKEYGYKNIGIILDRGYFSKKNLEYMDMNGFNFIIMAKSSSKFIDKSIRSVIGTFENDRKGYISKFNVYSKTYKEDLFEDDNNRYVHIYYNEMRAATERNNIEEKISVLDTYYKKFIGKKDELIGSEKYFDIVRDKNKIITSVFQKDKVIQEGKKLCGYFAIVTSKKMTAKDAIYLYKSRDESEKIFRMDKSYLGNNGYRVQSEDSMKSKAMIEFISLILRNQIYTYLDIAKDNPENRENFMTVPASLKELDKIEMIKQNNGRYILDYAVTATQNKILNAFGINPKSIPEKAKYISLELEKC